MLKTTKCRRCGATRSTWTDQRWTPGPTLVDQCDHCANRPAPTTNQPMTWTLEARATRTQFAPARTTR
jgi:methionyl-tRNA synthetase